MWTDHGCCVCMCMRACAMPACISYVVMLWLYCCNVWFHKTFLVSAQLYLAIWHQSELLWIFLFTCHTDEFCSLFSVCWQLIAFDELKTDYKNPIDQCRSLNPVGWNWCLYWSQFQSSCAHCCEISMCFNVNIDSCKQLSIKLLWMLLYCLSLFCQLSVQKTVSLAFCSCIHNCTSRLLDATESHFDGIESLKLFS